MRFTIIFIALLLMLGVTFVSTHQRSKYSEALDQLKSLTSEEVDAIYVYESDFPSKLSFEVFEKSDIDEFLNSMALAKKYSQGKRKKLHLYSVAIVIKPQEIHLKISDSEIDPFMVNGAIGKFKNTDHYFHYGNFQVSGLGPWVNKFVLQNDT